MKIEKAVITAAGTDQRKLPLQTLIDVDGQQKSVLQILVDEVQKAGIDKICFVVHPGDEGTYKEVVGDLGGHLKFVHQKQALGYGHALYSAVDFTGNDAFLHLVGDHLYVKRSEKGCAQHLVEVAKKEGCAISAVSALRENIMPHYGVVGGQRKTGSGDLYKIEKVIEKPTPTVAEQQLQIPGLRAGHYLCFFGMHVLTPTAMEILGKKISKVKGKTKVNLSDTLNEMAGREQYLALEKHDWRYDVGTKYGLLKAQIALALSGKDRDEVLSELLEFFALREMSQLGK